MGDNTIPHDSRLQLYMSSRYLQELEIALRLIGVHLRYERPGVEGLPLPRLVADSPPRPRGQVICVVPARTDGPDAPWWFEWWDWNNDRRERVCRATDMNRAARIIAAQLRERPA